MFFNPKFFTGLAIGALAFSGCGSSTKTVTLSTDFPLQGGQGPASKQANDAVQLYLEQIGYKAGDHTIEFKAYDNSIPSTGSWDEAQCTTNANLHVANTDEVAVIGASNSGCTKLEVPILNQAADGPMVMISHQSTYPGLTKEWETGEPEMYFPSGDRSFARVCTTDDNQGAAGAQFAAKQLEVKSVYVLNDGSVYGIGVATAFITEANKQGLEIKSIGDAGIAWDPASNDYTELFNVIKATNAEMVYIAGVFDNNGHRLVKDKFKTLGDNEAVKMMFPDGFTGYESLVNLPEADGAYITFAGLTASLLTVGSADGPTATFMKAYKDKYSTDLTDSYALYAVASAQFLIKAIAASDGTRKGVRDELFSGSGITLEASENVLGKRVTIDPETGGISAIDITIEQVKNKEETTLAWTVQ